MCICVLIRVSQREFVAGIEKLGIGIKTADLHSAFERIDVTQVLHIATYT